MTGARALRRGLGGCLLAAAVAACGQSGTTVSEAGTQPPLALSPLSRVDLVGDPSIVLASGGPGDARLATDDSGLLVIHLTVRNTSSTQDTVTMTATLLGTGGSDIGQATGGALNLKPGATADVELNGRPPGVTIAALRVRVITQPTPTR